MLENATSKRVIKYRRQVRDLEKAGFSRVPMHWYGPDHNQMITDSKIVGGREIFIKLAPLPTPTDKEE